MKKRSDYISWDEYFMGVAILAAKRSKDPNTQVGACIVSPELKIISTGYNGMPRGLSDDEVSWARQGEYSETKYPYVCHAELNAILNNPGCSLKGCSIYVALFPCNECAKAIAQAGIAEVVYLSDKYHDEPSTVVSRRILAYAGVKLRKLEPSLTSINISYEA